LVIAAKKERDISKDKPSDQVRCWTTKGRFSLDIYKAWAPLSAKHFVKLVNDNYYVQQALYQKIPDLFVAFFGMHYVAKTRWDTQDIVIGNDKDKGVKWKKGMICHASGRNTNVFIADKLEGEYAGSLGRAPHEKPFGIVTEGFDEVLSKFHGYPEGSFQSKYTTDVERFFHNNSEALSAHFPHLDIIVGCRTRKNETEFEDEFWAQEVQDAIALRQKHIDIADQEADKEWYLNPSALTVPDRYVAMCKKCPIKWCISRLACCGDMQGISPYDGLANPDQCDKRHIHGLWPADFRPKQKRKAHAGVRNERLDEEEL